MSNKTVRSIMRPVSTCLTPDMPLDKVSDHLTNHFLPGAPVLDNTGKLLGYVSVHDCLEQLMQSIYYCDNTALAEDVMSTKLITADPNSTLIDLATFMTQNKVNALPAVENDTVIGVLTRADLMKALVKELEICAVPAAS